jgi:OOP family OmpA-OmpF porin
VESKRTLDELASIANRCASTVIEIHGHSDAADSPSSSRRISERRVQAVADYLTSAGVGAHRLVPIAHGADLPIAPNLTAEQRALNRRIEFRFRDQVSGPSLSELLRDIR